MELSAELREVALEAQALAGELTVNGHTNGEAHLEEIAGSIADPIPSGSTLPALTETLSSTNPHPLPTNLDQTTLPAPAETESTLPTTAPAAAPAAAPTTWQAHNLDIDLISLKLSKHKYLTPSDFLADIAKIEENAEKLMDPDRITKIGEMGAHARMHVLNFDPAWEPRFEAYAARVRERKAKRAEKKAADATAATTGGAATGEVMQGEGQEVESLKRPREDGDDEEERGDKRHKEDIVMEEPTPATTTVETIPQPTEPTIPPPRPTYPPFILPPTTLSNLKSTLTHATSSFNIEQLEQLRANCFDTIWKYRAEWDRTGCLAELGKVVDGFVGEVEELKEGDEDYGV
jgi:hypothetical protein